MDTATPVMIGKYRIVKELAKGGMGTVYIAIHPSLKTEVIIKQLTIKSSSSSIRERFKREAKILMELTNAYVVRMFDYFTVGNSDFIVMEYVKGMAVDNLLEKQEKLPPEIALLIIHDACLGLASAHNKGIVHRDIKPGNILIAENSQIKLADFGIASGEKEHSPKKESGNDDSQATLAQASGENITRMGATLGTPAYMSPEQLMDSSSVDGRADIYSLGVTLYEMVTGKKPYPGDMSSETIQRINKGKYDSPRKYTPDLPLFVCSLIKKMMKAKPSSRFKDVSTVQKKIYKYLSRYDRHEIRLQLALAVRAKEKKTEIKRVEDRNRKLKKGICIAAVIAAVLGLGIYGWVNGAFHYTILRWWYTPVTLNLEMPLTGAYSVDLPAHAFFFENDYDKIPEVKGSEREFRVRKARKSSGKNDGEGEKSSLKMSTKPVFLKPGDYRIKIAEGPYVWWKSIRVTHDKVDLNLDFLKAENRKVDFKVRAFDDQSGDDITDKCSFAITWGNNKYFDLAKVDKSKLLSGRVYRIEMSCEGYKSETYGVLIDWYQDEVFVSGSLKRK